MEQVSGTAGDMATADSSGVIFELKEAVYIFLGNFFNWLSTHQALALIIILIVLGIMTWVILKARKYGKQLEKKVSSKNAAISKKDDLIEEQKNKLAALQKKLSDQRGVVSEALLHTIMSLTGYDIHQLKAFFKFLTEISENPLQIADNQANTVPNSRWLEEESDDSASDNKKEKLLEVMGPEVVVEANKSGQE